MQDFEKLGAFYLGKRYDTTAGVRRDDLVLYDSRDLVTHGVCVGMTGSGKTGLCLALLEEAAIDGIPAIIIDPKGDLANLMLTFPQLRAEDFLPWINADDAQRKGLTPVQFAQQQAELWTKGLAEWGQDGARIQRLRDAADVQIYTPGSSAGIQVSILKSFAKPEAAIIDDRDLFRERVQSTVTSLLGLIGIEADPVKSREHIFLSTVLTQAWSGGQDVDLAGLVGHVQKPAFTRIGVMELEAFYPTADRFALAMAINNLLASPGFAAWSEGEALDIGRVLSTSEGKPRLAIFSISHLADSERMFFVAMLLNQLLGWTRQQSGTTSLRAMLYMDEIAGYCPPVANPPSKQPLLTLMKQARAFGVGVLVATQNPVDLDYKGLSNAGTWFIGRLQTERDKQRVLEGLEGAAAASSSSFDRAAMDRVISGLGKRVFLMNNVHEDGPVTFESRWCLSYLRGPVTRDQIKVLMASRKSGGAGGATAASGGAVSEPSATSSATPAVPAMPTRASASSPSASNSTATPVLPPDVTQYFIPARSQRPAGAALQYRPGAVGIALVSYNDTKTGVSADDKVCYVATFGSGPVPLDWEQAQLSDFDEQSLLASPASGGTFASLPAEAGKAKSWTAWSRNFTDLVARVSVLKLLKCDSLDELSKAGESEREFRLRLSLKAREVRDEQVDKLRAKYATKVQTLQDRLRRAQQTLEVQQAQARDAKVSTAVSIGSALFGAFFGRKTLTAGNVSKAGTAMRGASRASREASDVGRAEESVQAVQQQLTDLQAQIEQEIAAITARTDPTTEQLESVTLRPKKTGVKVRVVTLAWLPYWVDAGGAASAAWL